MKVTLICSDPNHPVNRYLEKWVAKRNDTTMTAEIVQRKIDANGGDLLFLISCSEIINSDDTKKYSASLVLHASDLPKGRGWSPHIWELSKGADVITVSLLEVSEKVDRGRIWQKVHLEIPQSALWDEINHLLFQAELDLIDFAIANYRTVQPQEQCLDVEVTYWPRRTPDNSRINPDKTISEQFDLIRVCDPDRFPAFFEHLGETFILKLEKVNGR